VSLVFSRGKVVDADFSDALPSKIHVLADGRGRPVAFALTPGNGAGVAIAVPLVDAVAKPKRLLADKAYRANSLRRRRQQRTITTAIPSTASRRTPSDRAAYKRRNVIKSLFCKLKNWRRVATRYHRLAYRVAAIILSIVSASRRGEKRSSALSRPASAMARSRSVSARKSGKIAASSAAEW
jgi:transposase